MIAKHTSPFLVAALLALFLVGCPRAKVERMEWTTMGTVAAVQCAGDADGRATARLRDGVKRTFATVEELLNAHDPQSELSRLAALPDEEILKKCNPLVRPCYAAAFRLRDETGGTFNPRWRGAKTMDLGAIAKGFAVDLAVQGTHGAGVGRALVDLGGNLKSARGEWRVGIYDGGEFALREGEACATSAKYFRGDHIRDGRSGVTVTNAVRSVTVVHPTSAMLADGLSTVMFLLGEEAGERFLRERHPEARAIWYTTHK